MKQPFIAGKVFGVDYPDFFMRPSIDRYDSIGQLSNDLCNQLEKWVDALEELLNTREDFQAISSAEGARSFFLLEFAGDAPDDEYLTFIQECLEKLTLEYD